MSINPPENNPATHEQAKTVLGHLDRILEFVVEVNGVKKYPPFFRFIRPEVVPIDQMWLKYGRIEIVDRAGNPTETTVEKMSGTDNLVLRHRLLPTDFPGIAAERPEEAIAATEEWRENYHSQMQAHREIRSKGLDIATLEQGYELIGWLGSLPAM